MEWHGKQSGAGALSRKATYPWAGTFWYLTEVQTIKMQTSFEQASSRQEYLESQSTVMVSLQNLCVFEKRRNWYNLCVLVVAFRAQTKGGEWIWDFRDWGASFIKVYLSVDANEDKCPLADLGIISSVDITSLKIMHIGAVWCQNN